MTVRVLTGITTTGTLHLGNYCGAIRPCVRASRNEGVESFFFMADLHALIKCQDPERIERSRMQIAASWLAAGLDPEKVTFYRQSDIPEIPQLAWLLSCVCAKGLMNRAHAYKAAVEANAAKAVEPDDGVSMGLFCYPILMAADILMFNASLVPVGRDQVQHLEMARDMARSFNQTYGRGREFFVLPYEQIDEELDVLPGLDGRKMSKSYNNVIPLFDGGEKALAEAVSRIVTDCRLPGEAKDPDSTSLTRIYDAFATHEERNAFREELRNGLGWGDAKRALVARINDEIAPMREKYAYYMSHASELEDILQAGAAKARRYSVPFLESLKEAVGLVSFRNQAGLPKAGRTQKKPARPAFRQYREKDGNFYFKLADASGRLLLQSGAFSSGREAGIMIGRMKKAWNDSYLERVRLAEGVSLSDVAAAIEAMNAGN